MPHQCKNLYPTSYLTHKHINVFLGPNIIDENMFSIWRNIWRQSGSLEWICIDFVLETVMCIWTVLIWFHLFDWFTLCHPSFNSELISGLYIVPVLSTCPISNRVISPGTNQGKVTPRFQAIPVIFFCKLSVAVFSESSYVTYVPS